LQALKSISEATYQNLLDTDQVLNVKYFENPLADSFLEAGIPNRYLKFKERAKERIHKMYKNMQAEDEISIQLYRQALHLEMEEFGELTNEEDKEFM
jgi:hypothetical protein